MKMKLISILCAVSLALSLTACGTAGQTAADTGTDTNTPTVQVVATEVSMEGATTLTFTDSTVAAKDGDYTGYEIDGTAVSINGAGTYILTGTCADGSVTVKKGTTGVTLVLNGLDLTSKTTAPIACNKSTEVVIYAAPGSVNVLSDSAQNNDESYPDNTVAENAVIKCKDGSQVVLCGTGSLTVNANGKNGIKSGATTTEEGEASLTIRELTLTVNASVNDAVNAEQLLTIESGTLTISAADDALHSDLTLTIGADGTAGPTIVINNCYEGIEGATLNICSGDITINASDDCLNAADSELSGYDFAINISGGTITAYTSSGDGFDSNGDLNISGGSVAVWTASTADNQPLDADGSINISGGTVLAAGGSSGMGMNLTATQPCVAFSLGGMGGFGGGSGNSLTKGSAFTVSTDGTAVYSGEAVCNAAFVFYSSPDLTAESSYDLVSSSTTLATAAAQTGSVQSGMGGGQGGGMGGGQGGGMGGDMGGQPNGQGGGQMPNGGLDSGDRQAPPDGGSFQPNKQ